MSTGLFSLAIVDRQLFDTLMWEDNIGEWSTFFAFMLAGLIGLRSVFSKKSAPGANRLLNTNWVALLGLSVLCLFAAGEEISWAQRVFGFQPPEVFQQQNFQQELNVHNVLQARGFAPWIFFTGICLGYGLLLPILASLLRNRFKDGLLGWILSAAPSIHLAPWFTLTGLVYWHTISNMDLEAAELMFGMLFLADVSNRAACLQQHESHTKPVSSAKSLILLICAIALGGLTNPLLERFVIKVDPNLVAQTLNELQAIGRELEEYQGINPGIIESGVLADFRLYFGVRRDWLRFPDNGSGFLNSESSDESHSNLRRDYFLDPWNNAYWIRFQGTQPIYLYSFGPNRRLDTIMGDDMGVPNPDDVRGDDIGIWITNMKFN
ncbi:hypothetical protein [Pelagicoccus mobilis]|uniref:Uncharacterized protein n=1 Tax=Pelagicoccus mobilis TaxID=415221 RepID=A0A934RX96_9BACT|nr:hypothetical protein [Pelagicoccus mobilis]MBK1876481.1 hypothetical protein [Pelagicoccus mobilis]